MAIYNAVWALIGLPLFGAAISFLAETPRRAAQTCFVSTVLTAALAAVVLIARITHPAQPPFESLLTFFSMSPPENTVFATRFQAQIGVYVDSLSASFGVALAFVVVVVQAYALTTLRGDAAYRRFFWGSSVLAFGALGLVFSPNLFDTLLMWIVLSVAAYLVAAHWWDRGDAAAPARRAFLALHSADLALLLAVAVVFDKFGVYSSQVSAPPGQSLADPLGFDQLTPISHAVLQGNVHGAGLRTLAVMATILIVAAVVRAAQAPFHAWLTDTATSPVPSLALVGVSAGFAGTYLVARAFPLLLPPLHAISALALTGAVTAVVASVVCLAQRDVLRIAVLSGIAELGLVIAALGTGGYGQGLFVLLTSVLFTTLLVLCAGNLVRVYRTRNIHEMSGARARLRLTSAALIAWAGGTAGLSLGTYYALSSAFANAKPTGPAVGAVTRIAVSLLVVVAAALMAAYAARLLAFVLPGAPVRRRGFNPDRVTEVERSLRVPTVVALAGAIIGVLVGLPGVQRFTFTRFVYEYAQPLLPVDGWALLICLGAGGLGVALAVLAFAPARREAVERMAAPVAPLTRLAARDFHLERSAHRLGAPFLAAAAFVRRFDDGITETLADLAGAAAAQASGLGVRLRDTRTPIYLAGGLTIVAILVLLSVLAATGHLWMHAL